MMNYVAWSVNFIAFIAVIYVITLGTVVLIV